MSDQEIIKEYANDDLTVIWKPKLCIHAAECVKRLPEVYDPKAKPWIKPNNASAEALKTQIDACPSGALTYRMNTTETNNESKDQEDMSTKVDVLKNGPLLVHGTIEVNNADGNKEVKERTTAFCRCGASTNKPYCDGTHNNNGFVG